MKEQQCPNSDPNFDKILVKLFGSSTPEIRKKVYYFICIIVRLFLFSLVYIYKDHPSIPYIIGLASIVGISNLYPSMTKQGYSTQHQWWSKRFQFMIAILLFVTSVLLIFKITSSTIFIPIILFISLFGGIMQSMLITFC
jgi:hypothetical protein